jgi:hypothetical protein
MGLDKRILNTAEQIIVKLNEMGANYDHFEYGLPIYNDDQMLLMKVSIYDFLADMIEDINS